MLLAIKKCKVKEYCAAPKSFIMQVNLDMLWPWQEFADRTG